MIHAFQLIGRDMISPTVYRRMADASAAVISPSPLRSAECFDRHITVRYRVLRKEQNKIGHAY